MPDHDPTTPLSRDATTPLSSERSGELHQFAPNDVLAGRYRILRVAGAGGMGVVYEAEDLELGERVALKTLHAPHDAGERDIARLRREVQLARRVTHPNVCRIYDAGRQDNVIFVTMELLDGETLSHYLSARGRIPASEAKEILRQLCAGLQAAHDAGVIHRDFKSANVMLASRGSTVRAVITDFGLARTTTPSLDAYASHSGTIIGTPAYMAPEQIRGEPVTPATDIYALGIVAFELITGTIPFHDGSLSALVRRTQEAPPSPRQFVPDVDPRWDALIVRCLARDPRERFASAAEVARALDEDIPAPAPQTSRAKWPIAAAIAIAVIAALTVIATRNSPRATTQRTAATTPARRAVAILGFRNLSGRADAAWLSSALTEMLSTEIAAAESLRLVAGEEVARVKRDLAVTDVESHAPATLQKIRSATGADYVVLGSFVALPDKSLRVDVRVQKTTGNDGPASFRATGSESDLFALVANTGAQLRARLGGSAQLAQGIDLRRAVPVNAEAARHFAAGVARLRTFDAIGARDALQKAVAADPQFALAHAELSDAHAILGYDSVAAQDAAKAVELSAALPRSERILIEAKFHQRARRHDKAIELYRSLVALYPDDPEHRVRLVTALIDNSRGQDALAVVKQMDPREPRTPLLEAWAHEMMSDYPPMLAAADRAIAQARTAQNRDVMAEALIMRAWAVASMGRMPEAERAFDEAEDLFAASGNRAGVAKALRRRSFVSWRRGDLDEALRLNQRALKMYDEIGQLLGAANSTGGIGVILKTQGKLREARGHFEDALAIYRRIGDRQNTAWALSSIGDTYSLESQHDAAIRIYEEALPLARELGDLDQTAITLGALGQTYAAKGDWAKAESPLKEALTIFRKNENRSASAEIEASLGDLAFQRGDLRAARRLHEHALSERRAIGERGYVASSQMKLAGLELAEGNAAAALAHATAAATEFQSSQRTQEHADAMRLVARANAALGKRR
jgi:tetratricopeptide (TPR) repeat protein